MGDPAGAMEVEKARRWWWRHGEMRAFSPEYYASCAMGGMLSAGTTHLAITPLDVIKVNMQVNPVKYHSVFSGMSILLKEQGPSALWRGWSGKLFGYGVHGGCRFGLFEYFKNMYSEVLAGYDRSLIFLASSASAQIIADVALCPFESVKVRVQTQPAFAKGLLDGFPRLYATEGLSGFYRGLVPLWCRSVPFALVMFSTFEHTVDFIYTTAMQRRREDCSKLQQLGVSCAAGYIAGAIGTVVSNPADNIITHLSNKRSDSISQAMKSIGVANLFRRSLVVRFALVGPHITLQWLFYDTIKVLIGLPTSGGLKSDLEELDYAA